MDRRELRTKTFLHALVFKYKQKRATLSPSTLPARLMSPQDCRPQRLITPASDLVKRRRRAPRSSARESRNEWLALVNTGFTKWDLRNRCTKQRPFVEVNGWEYLVSLELRENETANSSWAGRCRDRIWFIIWEWLKIRAQVKCPPFRRHTRQPGTACHTKDRVRSSAGWTFCPPTA